MRITMSLLLAILLITLSFSSFSFADSNKEKAKDEYVKHLKKYAELDDESLENLGYTPEKIKMLRVYDGSEAQTFALSAECNLTLKIDYVTWSAAQNRTNARLEYNFAWTGVPLF